MDNELHEARTCKYFWEQKGDVESYVHWDKIKQELKATRPEVVAAVDALNIAKRTLTAVLNHWEDQAYGED